MNALSIRRLARPASFLLAGCLLGLAAQAAEPAHAAHGCTADEARNNPAACQKETAAAGQEGRRGNLTAPGAAAGRNATDRCGALAGSQKTDCMTRAAEASTAGSGTTTSGSVEGGGMIRETTTVVPAAKP